MSANTNKQNNQEKDQSAQSIIDAMKEAGLLDGMSSDDELEITFSDKSIIRKIEEEKNEKSPLP